MMDKQPNHAEQFTRSEFTREMKIESKILPGRMVIGPDTCHCPRCDKPFGREWEHGETQRCSTCYLFVLTFGNGIYIWEHP